MSKLIQCSVDETMEGDVGSFLREAASHAKMLADSLLSSDENDARFEKDYRNPVQSWELITRAERIELLKIATEATFRHELAYITDNGLELESLGNALKEGLETAAWEVKHGLESVAEAVKETEK